MPVTYPSILALAPLDYAAIGILIAALAALAIALRAAFKSPSGLRPLFGGDTADDSSAHAAAAELRELIAEARALADELAASFDDRAAGMARLIREAEDQATRLEQGLIDGRSAHTPNSTRVIESKPSPAPTGLGGDPMAGEIYRLADEGFAPVQIATRLGQHTGKVELILALRRGGAERV